MSEIHKLGAFEKAMLNLKKSIKKETVQEVDNLVKVIAVGIWADKKTDDRELEKAQEIIEKTISNDSELVIKLVSERLEAYSQKNWQYQQEMSEIMTFILTQNEWNYAEYMIEIFKADRFVSKEEGELAKHLYNLIESKKYFESKLGIRF